jgi:hypothetical protein
MTNLLIDHSVASTATQVPSNNTQDPGKRKREDFLFLKILSFLSKVIECLLRTQQQIIIIDILSGRGIELSGLSNETKQLIYL